MDDVPSPPRICRGVVHHDARHPLHGGEQALELVRPIPDRYHDRDIAGPKPRGAGPGKEDTRRHESPRQELLGPAVADGRTRFPPADEGAGPRREAEKP
jgi:hypothetical protein